MALHVIKSTNDFQRPLENWYALPIIQQTWLHLKTHFQNARKYMRKVRGKTMREAVFQTANNISEEIQEVKDELQTVQISVLEALADKQSTISQIANNIGQ